MNDLERRLQHALDTAATETAVSIDPWPLQQELLDGRRAHRRPNAWIAVVLTAAAAAIVLVLALLLVPALGGNHTTPEQPRPRPVPSGRLSPESQFSRAYLQRCLTAPQIQQDARLNPLRSTLGAVVRLVRLDQYGQAAVITTPHAIMDCEVDKQGKLNARGFGPWRDLRPHVLDAPVEDEIFMRARPTDRPVTEWEQYTVDLGRVASNVARVQYVEPGHGPITATIGNGVYILRYSLPYGHGEIRGYDTRGRLIYDSSNTQPPSQAIPWP